MFKKILLCTDLSEASEYFTDCVGQLKTLGVEKIILAHIIYVATTPDLDKTLARDAKPLLEKEKKRLEEKGASTVQIHRASGEAAEVILTTAKKIDCSFIVMGTHGKGVFGEVALGSCAHHVARKAEVPILYASSTVCSCV